MHVIETVTATDRIEDVRPQELVIRAVKAHHLESIAPHIPAPLELGTAIVTVQNGNPWWYFHKHGGEFVGRRLGSDDPSGMLGKNIDGNRFCLPGDPSDILNGRIRKGTQ